MSWQFILGGSLSIGTLIAFGIIVWRFKNALDENSKLKAQIQVSEEDGKEELEYAAKNQERNRENEKTLAEISSGPATASDVGRVLSRPIEASDPKAKAALH